MVSDAHVLGYVSRPIHPDDEMALARDLPPGYVLHPRSHPDHIDYRRQSTANTESVTMSDEDLEQAMANLFHDSGPIP